MMKTYILDANVTLRFLLADEPNQSPKAKELFALAESGRITLRLTHVAVAELVWVLTSFYDFSHADVGSKLRGLILHKGIEIAEGGLILDTLERFARVNADFPDCYAAALAAQGATPVTSYDRDFRKFPDVTYHSPDDILLAQ